MDAPNRYPGHSNYNSNRPAAQGPAAQSKGKYDFVDEDPKKKIEATKERIRKLHPDRTCVECIKNNQDFYKYTAEWRHYKDEKGASILKDASGKELWLCNKHGLAHDRAIKKASQVAAEHKITKKRMSVESVINPASKEEEAIHIRKKMSIDSLLDDAK